MPSQDKRLRKKENARLAREARIAAEKRRRLLRSARNAAIAVAAFALIIIIVNLVSGGSKKSASNTSTTTTPTTAATKPKFKLAASDLKIDPKKTYTASVTTNFGSIVLTLDTQHAPKASAHFITLARDGVYNGSRWHRIVKDFVIQGGAPGGDPNTSYGRSVVGELPTDHYPVGSLAAAKTGSDPNGTFDSQFFIVTGQQQGASLPNQYARFGTVKAGMDVVKKIEALPVDAQEAPTQQATIDRITITES